MKRRDVLKGLAISAAAAIPLGCSGHKEGLRAPLSSDAKPLATTYRLNIVVHGMMVLDFDDSVNPRQVRILMPQVADHTYAAGQWTQELLLDGTPAAENPYDPKYQYSILNVADAMVPRNQLKALSWPSATDVVINWSASSAPITSYSGRPRCVLSLPFPDDIWAYRPSDALAAGHSFFDKPKTAPANKLTQLTAIPLIHVLTYTKVKPAPNQPILVRQLPQNWESRISFDKTDHVARLHIFAEPAVAMADALPHLNEALTELNSLFTPPLDLRFNPTDQEVISKATSAGLDVPQSNLDPTVQHDEQFALEEHRAAFGANRNSGSRPSNCMNVLMIRG